MQMNETLSASALPWYQDAVLYEVHVRAFADAKGDGMGDFRGLTGRLDYLRDLGVTVLWLLPFFPSPLRDDGYDIADYTDVHPAYGTLADFKVFLREAHRRGLRVIIELVLNHTSDQHPWFQRARRARPGSVHRDFYVWSDTPEKYQEARIIFQDFETSNWTWDPVAGAYYWHRFYSHQPDLNFDNPRVRRAVMQAMDFWLNLGVDGFRLDAVPYLFEREGTSCENLPETHAFLRELRRHIDERFPGRMLLAEANQWPEDAVTYFGEGDECHMAYHFPVMPRLFMGVRMEDRFPIVDIMQQTPPLPPGCQWALFLRNHDELTLEMVTDEERDYMYRVYAGDQQARINLGIRRRLAPLLSNNRRRIELLNGLLFSLPGTPVIYYGDEIGMGDNIFLGDRDGVRTPMQWNGDRNAGFSPANRQRLYSPVVVDPEYHYEAVNVEAQQANPQSLLWWMRRLIALRRRHPAFGRGTLEFLHPDNRKVLAFIRRLDDEIILVVANLSRFSQCAELDLSPWRGLRPVEMFGQVEFPRIGDLPYFITLSPHGFYWFILERLPSDVEADGLPSHQLPVLAAAALDLGTPAARQRSPLMQALPPFLRRQRWFSGKARRIQTLRLAEVVTLPYGERSLGTAARSQRNGVGQQPDTVADTARSIAAEPDDAKHHTPPTSAQQEAVRPSHLQPQHLAPAAQPLRPDAGEEQQLSEHQAQVFAIRTTHSSQILLTAVSVEYADGDPETYVLPLAAKYGDEAEHMLREFPGGVVARLAAGPDGREGVLYDAGGEREFAALLLDVLVNRRRPRGREGEIVGVSAHALRRLAREHGGTLEGRMVQGEQSNTSYIYDDWLFAKLFRRAQAGVNPDLEMNRFLSDRGFAHTPHLHGFVEYRRAGSPPVTLAMLEDFVPETINGWNFTRDALVGYFERVAAFSGPPLDPAQGHRHLLDLVAEAPPEGTRELFGGFLEAAWLLGRRTGELHRTLAGTPHQPEFAPEPVTTGYLRSLYQTMRNATRQAFDLLRRRLPELPEAVQARAREVLSHEAELLARVQEVAGLRTGLARIRVHGDYHLGQALYTGNDFIIIDFEGEPTRPLSERRLKRLALRDVAGMLRSFDYAAWSLVLDAADGGLVLPLEAEARAAWARFWLSHSGAAFLRAYLEAVRAPAADGAGEVVAVPPLLPTDQHHLAVLLDAMMLEKAVYELAYELNHRPRWVEIPLQGLATMLTAAPARPVSVASGRAGSPRLEDR